MPRNTITPAVSRPSRMPVSIFTRGDGARCAPRSAEKTALPTSASRRALGIISAYRVGLLFYPRGSLGVKRMLGTTPRAVDTLRNDIVLLGMPLGATMPDEMGSFRVDVEIENPARPGERRALTPG